MTDILPSTGNDIVDSLQGLQRAADALDDPEAKIDLVRRDIHHLGATALFNHNFMVSAAQIFAKSPDLSPDTRVAFRDFVFLGRADAIAYMQDWDIPLDSLTLNFSDPDVLGVNPEHLDKFRIFTFQIPVLAIDSCVSLEVA